MDTTLEQDLLAVRNPRVSLSFPSLSRSGAGMLARLLDLAAVAAGVASGYAAFRVYHHGAAWPDHPDLALALAGVYWLMYVLLGAPHGLYSARPSLLHVRDTETVLRTSTFCLLLFYAEGYLLHMSLPRLAVCVGWPVTVLSALAAKHLNRRLLSTVWRWRKAERHVIIVGTGRDARRLFSYLRNSPHLGIGSVCFINETEPSEAHVIYSHDYKHRWHAPVQHCVLNIDLLQSSGASEVFVADPTLPLDRLQAISALAVESGAQLSVIGGSHFQHGNHQGVLRNLDGVPVITYAGTPAQRRVYQTTKRCVDFALALVLMALSGPVWLVAALMVRFTSPGPVFFTQERVGLNGSLFKMYKFRSMYTHAPKYGRSPEDARDTRITPVGRFLRKTSLDELPQLLNVLRGEMAVVGPRPEMPYVVAQYTPTERRRLSVPQGLTGLWQLSADRKYSIHESVEYDLYYVDHRGLYLDAAILLHTFLFAMKGV